MEIHNYASLYGNGEQKRILASLSLVHGHEGLPKARVSQELCGGCSCRAGTAGSADCRTTFRTGLMSQRSESGRS